MNVYVKYVRDIEPIKHIKRGNWIDLRCAEDVSLKKGEFALIPLGVCMKLPAGYEALLVPRSSTFKHYGVIQTNSIGVIDESYCGDTDEWLLPVYATRDTFIPKNDRICQFRVFNHQVPLWFNTVETLDSDSRGGFGSTGRN